MDRQTVHLLIAEGLAVLDHSEGPLTGTSSLILSHRGSKNVLDGYRRETLALGVVHTDINGVQRETAAYTHLKLKQLVARPDKLTEPLRSLWSDISNLLSQELARRTSVAEANRRRRGRPSDTVRLPNVEGGWRETLALVLRLVDGDESVRATLAARLEVLR